MFLSRSTIYTYLSSSCPLHYTHLSIALVFFYIDAVSHSSYLHPHPISLSRRTRNEEPLINTRINRRRLQVLSLWNAQLARILHALRTMLHRGVLQANLAWLRLARNQLLPCLRTLAHHVHRVLSVLALAAERKLVLGLAVGDLVDAEPFVGGADQAR